MTQRTRPFAALAALLTLALAAPAAHAEWTLNMTPGISAMSRRIYSLHMLMFWWCVGIAVVVFGVMIYSMVRFRKSTGRGGRHDAPAQHRLEIVWTLIPVLILISMAVPAARTLIETEDTRNGAKLTIRITGYQWKWGYEYLDIRRDRCSRPGSRQRSRPPARIGHRPEHGAALPAQRRPPAGRARPA